MEKMSRKKALDVIFIVVFIGIILSFSILFSTTLIFPADDAVSEEHFDGVEREENIFSDFDNACLKNKRFYRAIKEYEYKLFNNIAENDVISGKDGFVFSAGVNEYGYDYVKDYTGKVKLTDDQLDHFHKYIEMRSQAYENFGSTYVLAVIPNAQTVYGEYMPDYIGSISDNTMLSQIGAYLESQGFDEFIDLGGAMIEGKKYGQLYNNTENTVNAIGAYVAYAEIVEHLKSRSEGEINGLAPSFFTLQTRITDGKTLAKKAGLSSIIKNKTIFISDSNEQIYNLVELFGDLETTYTKYEYRSLVSQETVLLECVSEWDKVQLMPYFSSTFSRASYRVTHAYSRSAVSSSIPDVVVQIIREDELLTIIDDDMQSTYNAGLEPGQHPYKTATVADAMCSKIKSDLYCVTGTVERGAEITLFGDGIETVVAQELDGRFFATVKVSDFDVATQICISVSAKGKSVSDVSYVLISAEDEAFIPTVFVGENSMLYKDNYDISGVPADYVINQFASKVEEYFKSISSVNSDTKIILSLVPEKISVYKDSLSETLAADATELQVKRMILERILSQSGVTFIDGADVLRDVESDTKLYYQTFDMLTDTGNYYLYRELMTVISGDFSAAAPNPLDSGKFIKTRNKVGMGELASALGFKKLTVNENAVKINVDYDVEYEQYGTASFDISKAFISHNDNYRLPTAVVVRSGDCDKMVEMMAEHFSVMYVFEKGETEVPEYILSEGVDYVIVLTPEADVNIG